MDMIRGTVHGGKLFHYQISCMVVGIPGMLEAANITVVLTEMAENLHE